MKLVIVESPAKAKTIEKYLGSGFKVLASYGHIRDLPSKVGSVDPDKNFEMVWEDSPSATKAMREIIQAVKKSSALYLASDPDREGEAIAWHVLETLKKKKLLDGVEIHRVAFNQITKKAVLEAIENPRKINQELVDAYLARRALDYLVGFNLSPVLWRKLPGSKSAGRVQSVALRLITSREAEIEDFNPQEYWSITADCKTEVPEFFQARIIHAYNEKIEKLTIENQEQADKIVAGIKGKSFTVKSVEKKQVKRSPQPPFTTSTLQQESVRKLSMSSSNTMRTAQKLYEGINIGGETVGLITYMRTDSIEMAAEAVQACRGQISNQFGSEYLPDKTRVFKSKVKNAQEAHESIRPTDFSRTPESMKPYLDAQQLKFYSLIWKRAIASQMKDAQKEQMAVDIVSNDANFILRANGSRLLFDGFLKVYEEGSDHEQEKENQLPNLKEQQQILIDKIHPKQHFTQPPPRYTEASLVKKLEEIGIGRPSTYATIISVLQSREYVVLKNKQFIPEERGRLVSTFLEHFFKQYVEYDFTAQLENELDAISTGQENWIKVLEKFWVHFHKIVDETKGLKNSTVLDVLDAELTKHFFPDGERNCPKCKKGKLHLKVGKYGAFVGCEEYPECDFIRKDELVETNADDDQKEQRTNEEYPKILGKNESDEDISLRKGPYGFYLQVDKPQGSKDKSKPKRAGLPKGMKPDEVSLETALNLLSLPKVIGQFPGTNEDIMVGIGRYGPFVKYQNKFYSLKDMSILSVDIPYAVALIEKNRKK
ncbi:MAG: DNA topoisomerase I [Rickettsiales bacterium]|nr:DNA topoisomerase I [Rickettsiales bacterium]|tara:strand:+ start:40453 stop:42762 length:2310 start_codon:yes stop_codon:yes gene_type:complete